MNDPATDNLPVLWPVDLLNPTLVGYLGHDDTVYLNIKQLIAIEPCGADPNADPPITPTACYVMVKDGAKVNDHILYYKSTHLFDAEVARFQNFLTYLRSPNVAPTVTITGQTAMHYGSSENFQAVIVDTPGDVHTVAWSENSASMAGGTFETPNKATTNYRAPASGTDDARVVVQAKVTDAKGETAMATHSITLTTYDPTG